MEGYIMLEKDAEEDKPHGKCGIAVTPSYPIAAPPPPTPKPSPTPKPNPAPQPDEYEDPNIANGCHAEEFDARIQGVEGSICMPKCKRRFFFFETCPHVPEGFLASAQCMVEEEDGTRL